MLRSFFSRFCFGLAAAALLLSAAACPASAAACKGKTYIIQAGESLYSIAETCGIPYTALVGINVEISNPDLVRPGQVIRLAAGVPLEASPAIGAAQPGGLQEGGVYIARPGDSLARIAYLYQTSIPDLLRENPQVSKEQVIFTGQSIRLPGSARLEAGWVGLSTLIAKAGQTIVVRVMDFPAYADIDINIGEMGLNQSVLVETTVDGQTDALGQARILVTLPTAARTNEEYVVEVVTSELPRATRSMSPTITIQ